MENYIDEIKQILEKTGWSQGRFSQEIGVTFATVNRWLKGHTKPHWSQLKQINKLFKSMIGIIPLSDDKIKNIIELVEKKKNECLPIKDILENEKIYEEFLLELTYNSDAIEGSTLTKKETEAIIFDKANIKDKSLVEHLEVVNHTAILKDIFTGKIDAAIEENSIKQIHKYLMQGIREDAGQYSKHQRGIRGVDLILPHPDDIEEEMVIFLNKVNSFKEHSIKHIAKMHADFELIHPFGDGNGRVGRLIMISQLIKKGYCPCAISVDQKSEYYEYLEYAQRKSDTHFIYFFAESILKGYDIIKKYYK